MKITFFISGVVLFASVFNVYTLDKPLVYTSLGVIQGIQERTTLGKKIYAFLGVPYAAPPTGELRFEPPQPVTKWPGIWDATNNSAVCLQHMLNYDISDLITGEEDCLYLNIYSPIISNSSLLPVVVYFHGGAFMYGTGNIFTPHFIFDRFDFVYVSVNYRLGPLGFLSTGDAVVPGNNGLKDQNVALKWIQEHIKAFGGNKDDVTLAGLSAGGASVHLHYLSPLSKGLFKRGISMSGSAFCPWVLTENSAEKTKMIATALGCPIKDSENMVQCLKQRPGRKILSKLKSLFWPFLTVPFSPLAVVVETSGDQPFLNEHPYKLVKEGNVSDLPWLTSITTEEGLYPAAAFVDRENLLQELNDNWPKIVPHLLDYNYTVSADKLDSVSKKIRQFYLGDKEVSVATRNNVVKMVGDRLFNVDMERASRHQAAVMKSPVYFYEFGYGGKYSISTWISKFNTTLGVSHGDDQIFILSRPVLNPFETEQDKAMMMKMTNIWTSFILTDKPSPEPSVQWDPVSRKLDSEESFTYLRINSPDDIHQTINSNLANSHFWDSLKFDELQNIVDKIQIKDEL